MQPMRSGIVDVRGAYAPYCKVYNPDNKYCPSRQK